MDISLIYRVKRNDKESDTLQNESTVCRHWIVKDILASTLFQEWDWREEIRDCKNSNFSFFFFGDHCFVLKKLLNLCREYGLQSFKDELYSSAYSIEISF